MLCPVKVHNRERKGCFSVEEGACLEFDYKCVAVMRSRYGQDNLDNYAQMASTWKQGKCKNDEGVPSRRRWEVYPEGLVKTSRQDGCMSRRWG